MPNENNNQENVQVVDACLSLMAIKHAGYRSTATALGELIDNSIQAKADNINIIVINQNQNLTGNRTSNNVYKLGVLDDGHGMDYDDLSKCLSLGWGTRLDATDGLGKFGFGLKGSSISQASIIKVYSWTDPDCIYMTKLDINEICQNKSQHLDHPIKCNLPSEIKKSLPEHINDSGTLVFWENLDLEFKTSSTLSSRLNEELCRIYRHFLDDDDDYGRKRNIRIKNLQYESGVITSDESLMANDPLYQLTPTNLGKIDKNYTNVQTNIEHHVENLPIEYIDQYGKMKVSNVKITFTVALPSVQALGGNSSVGKHYEKNTGISFVRAGREIDFGRFGFVDNSDPRHRWWGAEIRFSPVLDDNFSITNNKQHVRGVKALDSHHVEELRNESEMGNLKAKMVLSINKAIQENISEMMSIIKSRGAGKLSHNNSDDVVNKANTMLENNNKPTESSESNDSIEDRKNELKNLIHEHRPEVEDSLLDNMVEEAIDLKVNILEGDWSGELFLDRKKSIGRINRDHKFYDKFWSIMEASDDKRGFEALKLIMLALIRAEDELAAGEPERTKLFAKYRSKWGSIIDDFLD